MTLKQAFKVLEGFNKNHAGSFHEDDDGDFLTIMTKAEFKKVLQANRVVMKEVLKLRFGLAEIDGILASFPLSSLSSLGVIAKVESRVKKLREEDKK